MQKRAIPGNKIVKKYSIGWIIVDGELIWTNIWFKTIHIQLQRYKVRYRELDSMNYQTQWGDWEIRWFFKHII